MRLSAGDAANAAAWAVIVVLVAAAIVMARLLGFAGLFILGGATWLVCLRAEMDQDAPTWGRDVFAARMEGPGSPEQRAARLAERSAFLSPLRFYRRCGMALAAVGMAGFLYQQWGAGLS